MSAAEIGTAVFAIVGFTSTVLVCGFFALLGFYMLRDAWRKAGERAARMRKLREARKAAVEAPTFEAPLPWNPEWDHAEDGDEVTDLLYMLADEGAGILERERQNKRKAA